jgi:hypothetical protein
MRGDLMETFRRSPQWLPQDLLALPQFVNWRFEDDGKSKKPRKVPIDPRSMERADVSDPRTWGTYVQVSNSYRENTELAGIGFVFAAADPYCGIDFDECFADGQLKMWALTYSHLLHPTYAEISPSGNGIKFIAKARKPASAKCKKLGLDDSGGAVEVYDHARYFTLTGNIYGNTPHPEIVDRQKNIETLCQLLWQPRREPAPLMSLRPSLSDVSTGEMSRREKRCLAYMKFLPESIEGNDGSGACLRAACETQRFGLDNATAWRCLNWFNDNRCSPPWSSYELEHKLESAIVKVEEDGGFGSRVREPTEATERANVISIKPSGGRVPVKRITPFNRKEANHG